MSVQAEILSINVGKPKLVMFQNKPVSTGFFKQPITDPVFLSSNNFEGDEQADLTVHGGPDKAVCVYAYEHYPHWEQELDRPLSYAAFGENLTIRGLLEDDVCIGDIYRLGEALVQVSQPRQPCYKIAIKHGRPDLTLKVQQTGFTGFYLRVLETGVVTQESGLVLMKKHPLGVTVTYANRIKYEDKQNEEGIRRILAVDALSASWRQSFKKRLESLVNEAKASLEGS